MQVISLVSGHHVYVVHFLASDSFGMEELQMDFSEQISSGTVAFEWHSYVSNKVMPSDVTSA